MVCKHFRCALFVLFALAGLSAQTGQQSDFPGDMPNRQAQASPTNSLITGIRMSTDFDDNAFNDNRTKEYSVTTVAEPHLGWAVSHARFNWLLDYQFGQSVSLQPLLHDSQSHRLDTDLQLRLTQRLKVRLRNNFLESANPFDRLPGTEPTGFGVLDRPNDIILTTVRRSSEQAGLDLTYALGPHSLTGASASFVTLGYGAPTGPQPATAVPEDASSINGHVFFTQHLTPRYWGGLEYNTQKLSSQNGQSTSLVHSVFLTQAISFSPNMTVSAFAGPERSTLENAGFVFSGLPAGTAQSHSAWHWAGGAVYYWFRPHNTLVISSYRKISDGGGLLGIVRLTGVTADFHQEINRRWTADLLASYSHNQLLSAPSGLLSYISASGGLKCRLSQSVLLELRYWKDYVPANDLLAFNLADHNRVSVSLEYSTTTQLGK